MASYAAAFPNMDKMTAPLAARAYAKAQAAKRQIDATAPQGAGALPLVPPPFNAKAQYVSNKGTHKVGQRTTMCRSAMR